MVKKGKKMECGLCGLEVVCVEGCGCDVDEIICCGKSMKPTKRKASSKAARKKPAAKKQAKRKR
jgi:hypothetical protein